jgi:hypothetical protein
MGLSTSASIAQAPTSAASGRPRSPAAEPPRACAASTGSAPVTATIRPPKVPSTPHTRVRRRTTSACTLSIGLRSKRERPDRGLRGWCRPLRPSRLPPWCHCTADQPSKSKSKGPDRELRGCRPPYPLAMNREPTLAVDGFEETEIKPQP